jgi:hypothetical protein
VVRREEGEGRREKGEGRREKGEGRREKGDREKGEGRREKGGGRKEGKILRGPLDQKITSSRTALDALNKGTIKL